MSIIDRLFGSTEKTSSSYKSKSSQSTELDDFVKYLSENLMTRAMDMAQLPYQPFRGVSVAGVQPGHMAGFDGLNSMAASLGRGPTDYTAGLPDMETINGLQGYTTGDMFDKNVELGDPEGLYGSAMSEALFSEEGFNDWQNKNRPKATTSGGKSAPSDPVTQREGDRNRSDSSSTTGTGVRSNWSSGPGETAAEAATRTGRDDNASLSDYTEPARDFIDKMNPFN